MFLQAISIMRSGIPVYRCFFFHFASLDIAQAYMRSGVVGMYSPLKKIIIIGTIKLTHFVIFVHSHFFSNPVGRSACQKTPQAPTVVAQVKMTCPKFTQPLWWKMRGQRPKRNCLGYSLRLCISCQQPSNDFG